MVGSLAHDIMTSRQARDIEIGRVLCRLMKMSADERGIAGSLALYVQWSRHQIVSLREVVMLFRQAMPHLISVSAFRRNACPLQAVLAGSKSVVPVRYAVRCPAKNVRNAVQRLVVVRLAIAVRRVRRDARMHSPPDHRRRRIGRTADCPASDSRPGRRWRHRADVAATPASPGTRHPDRYRFRYV